MSQPQFDYYVPDKTRRTSSMDDESVFYCYKVVLLGDSATGKTSLLQRYTSDTFNFKLASTIGVDFKIKTINIDGKLMKMQFWDTAGQERFRAVVTSYHRSVNGVMLVYDITNRQSFYNIAAWKRVVESYNPREDFSVVVVGNKCELTSMRQVSVEEGRALADEHGGEFFETSAKDNVNVSEAFQAVAQAIKDNLVAKRNQPIIPEGTQPVTHLVPMKQGQNKKKECENPLCC